MFISLAFAKKQQRRRALAQRNAWTGHSSAKESSQAGQKATNAYRFNTQAAPVAPECQHTFGTTQQEHPGCRRAHKRIARLLTHCPTVLHVARIFVCKVLSFA